MRILRTRIKLLAFSLPLNSAKNLLPLVPKKFVTIIVIMRQKLIVIFIEPSTSLPKNRAIKKLKLKGTRPTKKSARPVYTVSK